MKIENLKTVVQLNAERKRLISKIEDCDNCYVRVEINGNLESAALADAIRPAVVEVLRSNLARVENELEDLGVEL